MLYVKDVIGPLNVGEYYLVDTVRLHANPMYDLDAEKIYIVPVLGPAHSDNDGAPHMHLDQRFMGNKLFRKFGIAIFGNPEINARPMRCVRVIPYVPVTVKLPQYHDAVMKNWTCPHKGTYLGNVLPVNGCVTCPMHGLTFQCDTGERKDLQLDLVNIRKLRWMKTIIVTETGQIR